MTDTGDEKDPKDDWPALMATAQDGDSRAYERLLREITPVIRAFLYRRIFNKNNVEDILQDVLLGIHRARHTYDPTQPFEHWMYGVARHKMIDAIRKETRRGKNEFSSDDIETFLSDTPNSNDKEWSRDLEKAIATLPEKQRRIIAMTKIEGHSVAETAKELGMSESAVKVAAHRACKKMEHWLVRHGY